MSAMSRKFRREVRMDLRGRVGGLDLHDEAWCGGVVSGVASGSGGGENPCTDKARRAVYDWTTEDFDAAKWAAGQLNVPLIDLFAVFSIETGGKFNPGIVNCWPDGVTCCNAIGLNQITPPNARAMGISESERMSLMDMTPAEQMPYVVRSFQAAMAGKWKAGAWPRVDDVTLYQVNLAPATVPNEVLYSAPSKNYEANKGLDVDKDGAITRSDLRTVIDKHKTAARTVSMYQQATGELPPAGGSGSGDGPFPRRALGAVLLAGAFFYMVEIKAHSFGSSYSKPAWSF